MNGWIDWLTKEPGQANMRTVCAILTVSALLWVSGSVVRPQEATDPGDPGPCTITHQTVQIDGRFETTIYYPNSDQCGGGIAAPYPAIAFAFGFSMGFGNGADSNVRNAEHLASWGYVVALPTLPDDFEERASDLQATIDYLETEAGTPGSTLGSRIDVDRFATAGHSLGGATALALAARDDRVQAVVALDPVYHGHEGYGGSEIEVWDAAQEAPDIAVPACILGAPGSACNSQADYAEIYGWTGAAHKASFLIVGASHCDFMDPVPPICGWICGGTSADRTRLSQKYMTAWFNYYLHLDTAYFGYLYGDQANEDIPNRVVRGANTAPRGFTASRGIESITLDWERYEHPIIAGYNIFRRTPGHSYPQAPQTQVGCMCSHVDSELQAGQVYSYTLCSRDAAGNMHHMSDEVSAVPLHHPEDPSEDWYRVYLPFVRGETSIEPQSLK